MSIDISAYPPSHTTETDHESWHYERIEYLRDTDYHERGEDFITDLELIPVTNYFGLNRAIAIGEHESPVSILSSEDMEDYWALVTYLHAQNETLEVSARVWTSPEHREFYASVRIDLPTIEEAEEKVRYELDLDDDFNFKAVPDFQNVIEDYTSDRWRAAHGMSDAEYQQRVEETARKVAEIRGTKPWTDSLHEAGLSPFATPNLAQSTPPLPQPVGQHIDWITLLRPDGTPRATPFQRGFTRGSIGKHFENNRAPRIDYATVGQCRAILRAFGEPDEKLSKEGRGSWAMWWSLMVILFILVSILSFIPGIGGAFPLAGLIVLGHHFWTRRKLQPPFTKQQ